MGTTPEVEYMLDHLTDAERAQLEQTLARVLDVMSAPEPARAA